VTATDRDRGLEGSVLKVLIAEVDLIMAETITDALISAGYEVCGVARTVSEGVALGRAHRPDLAIIDVRLADSELGTEIVTHLRDSAVRIGVLYVSGYINQGIDLNVGDACIAKPYDVKDLLCALKIVQHGWRSRSGAFLAAG
jgi:DNA-binding response OmpR family regulator